MKDGVLDTPLYWLENFRRCKILFAILFCFQFTEGAASAKLRLEESQRARRKDRNINGTVWEPLWFTLEENEYVECKEWKFNNKYWNRDFSKCTEIFWMLFLLFFLECLIRFLTFFFCYTKNLLVWVLRWRATLHFNINNIQKEELYVRRRYSSGNVLTCL